jgi:hypothetical protein
VRLAVDFLAVDLFAAGLRAAAVFFRPVVFLRVVLRVPDDRFRVAAAFFPARDLTVALRFRVAAAFFAAADRFLEVVVFRVVVFFLADVFFAADFFLRAGGIPHLLSSRQDAMRFRRRLSRSLMPPHTPYRSSRRSA